MEENVLIYLLTLGVSLAYVDPACEEIANAGPPADYSELTQNNFLLNYYALATTFSALHGPIPHKPGTGSIGLELSILPPLGCKQRLVLDYTKTEDTNKTPILPRPRGSFAFPAYTDSKGRSLVPYAGPTFSLGWQGSPRKNLDVAAEFYTAPFSLFDVDGFKFSSRDGSIYTGKFKLAYLF